MIAKNVLNHIEILAKTKEYSTISDIASDCSSSRSTVKRFIETADDWSLIRSSHDITLTAAGRLILREHSNLSDDIQESLSLLTGSDHGPELLKYASNEPANKSDLAEQIGVSRTTVHRLSREGEWIHTQNGHVELTDQGREVKNRYEEFCEKVKIITEKAEFLERFETPTPDIDIPLEALANSRQIVSTMTDDQKLVREVIELVNSDIELLHGIAPGFSANLSEASYANISSGTNTELIVDRSVYAAITHPKRWKYLFEGFRRSNFTILIYPGKINIGIMCSENDESVISAHNEQYPLYVGVAGAGKTFDGWVQELYEHYRDQAISPGKDLIRWGAGL